MIYIAGFILLFLILRMFIAFSNLISFPWPGKVRNKNLPFISILVPARNEEDNIETLIYSIINQDHQNFELIIYDDDSTDKTQQIIRRWTQKDQRIKYLKGNSLPEGWLGKNYGCHQLAKIAKGKYFLFIDADVKIKKKGISATLDCLIRKNLSLLSIFPKQTLNSFGEKITVPVMNWILISLLPLFMIRICKWPSFSAANGQFMLFNAENYRKHWWHKIVKNNKVEDIEIAKKMKKTNYHIHTLLGNEDIQCRMYQGYSDAVSGFSKNVLAFFGNSTLWMLLFTFITSFGFLLIIFSLPLKYIAVYLCTFIILRITISICSKQNILENLFFAIPQQLSFIHFVINSFKNRYNNHATWKGRNIHLN